MITNRKIAGLEPRWAVFKGFSLLFDNPGRSVAPLENGWSRIHCDIDGDESLQLYRGLGAFLDAATRTELSRAYLFCPLPSFSYHVTVWDGFNDENISQAARDIGGILSDLPHTLLENRELSREILASALVSTTGWSLQLKFDRLALWGNQVLVARLEPADLASGDELDRITQDRRKLSGILHQPYGVAFTEEYMPHVSLGYFANESAAESAASQVERWTARVEEKVGSQTITFDSISLYGFTDMVTFFKQALP